MGGLSVEQQAARIYNNPYMSMEEQLCAIADEDHAAAVYEAILVLIGKDADDHWQEP